MSLFRTLFCFTSSQVKLAFKQAHYKASCPGLKLLVCPVAEPATDGKLLIIVPKKFGNAPKRNKIKRQLKSIYFEEKLFKDQRISIILAYAEAKKFSFEELKIFLVQSLQTPVL